jgi:prephenate dehydrogenase
MGAGARSVINRLCIIGLGLMGGSLAAALKAQGMVNTVVATGRRSGSLQRGVELGVIDEYTLDLAAAVRGADMVVIATPTQVAEAVLESLAPLMTADMIVTDVASVKGNMQQAAERIFGEVPANLVLAHPIAGSEQSGVDAAKADLFRDHRVILTPLDNTDADAVSKVRAMWQACGAEVLCMSVSDHDAVLASTSHLPHVLAYTLVDALAKDGRAGEIFKFAAGGFRDFTRIASSDPTMWHDIVLANRDAVLAGIDQFSCHLAELRSAIEQGDGAKIYTVFDQAKKARDEHFLGQYLNGQSAKKAE